jgi:hypothetical protein
VIDAPLRECPSEAWQTEYDALVQDPWLRRKIDRNRRLREHSEYIDEHCEILKTDGGGCVVDVGPGPGEFLEIARALGHTILGIDAPRGDGGMGDSYLKASQLMHQRQGIECDYQGFWHWIKYLDKLINKPGLLFVNFRGSIEQCFSGHMRGIPHDKHHCSKRLSWKEERRTEIDLAYALEVIGKHLMPGGEIMIHANGAENTEYYDMVMSQTKISGLKLVLQKDLVLHKWKKS